MSSLTVGEWVGVDEIFGRVRSRRQNPKVALWARALRLCIGQAEYGSLGYSGSYDWPIVEGRYTPCYDAPAGLPTSPGSASVLPNSTW